MTYGRSVLLAGGDTIHLEPATDAFWGRRFTALGDSIVWAGDSMWEVVAARLGFATWRNEGVSGRPVADGTANGVGTVTTALDLTFGGDVMVIIAGGTNDFRLDVPLGAIGFTTDTSHDRESFYGAYRTILDHVTSSNPEARIFLATPLHRDNAGYTSETRNGAGHMLRDYVDAVKALGQMYAVPVIDMHALSGISHRTLDRLTKDGLHPNDAGYAAMSRVAVAQIRATA